MYVRWAVLLWCVLSVHWLPADDALSCRQLIDMVGQDQPVDQAKAESLQRAVGTSPQLKSLAAQSMALVSIRSSKYSEAWKYATSDSASLAAASRSVQLTNEKIKLWLFIEARSNEAEEQLKRFVSMTIHADTSEVDRQDSSFYLGKLLKLLDGCEASCGVNKDTVIRARQLLEAQSSKAAVTMFQSGWTESEQWHSQLLKLIAKCQTKSQCQATVNDLSNELERHEKKIEAGRQQLKQEKGKEDKLDRDRESVLQQIRKVVGESNRETPGKPKPPSPPRSKPSHPGNNAKAAERAKHERDMREYNAKMDRYHEEVRDYKDRVKQWDQADRQRRAQLAAQKTQLDQLSQRALDSFKVQEKLVKDLNVGVSQLNQQLSELNQKLELARLLLTQAGDGAPKLETLQRPSVYHLLDFSREAARLSKMVSAP